MKKYFSMPYEEVLNEFNVTSEGLSEKQLKDNLEKYGLNQLTEKKKQTYFKYLLVNLKTY